MPRPRKVHNRLGLQNIWNDSVKLRPQKELKPRDRLWASELGKAPIDVYYKVRGEKPTNPFTKRALRKFEAGNFWEWAVGMVLTRAGVLNSSQEWFEYQFPGLMKVTGRLDFYIGGDVDWEQAKKDVETLKSDYELPDFMSNFADEVIKDFEKRYPDGIEPAIIELKSSSSFMFDEYEKTGADPQHVLQCLHYMIAKDIDRGYVTYLCKDDVRMLEFEILKTPEMVEWYKSKVENLTHYIRNSEVPPKEKEIVFNAQRGKFTANWKLAYSSYLTKVYGYKNQAEFDDKNKKKAAKWNRVIARIVDPEKELTDYNKEVIEEIKFSFPNFDELIEIAKEVNGGNDSEEVSEDA